MGKNVDSRDNKFAYGYVASTVTKDYRKMRVRPLIVHRAVVLNKEMIEFSIFYQFILKLIPTGNF